METINYRPLQNNVVSKEDKPSFDISFPRHQLSAYLLLAKTAGIEVRLTINDDTVSVGETQRPQKAIISRD